MTAPDRATPTPEHEAEAREKWARLIAFWHGQKIVARRDGETITHAARSGFPWRDTNNDGASRYADALWHEYDAAADAVLEALADAERRGMERAAGIADDKTTRHSGGGDPWDHGWESACESIAKAIRSAQ